MGHSEYDALTLEGEYLRDKDSGLDIEVPKNYYPGDDDTKDPIVTCIPTGSTTSYTRLLLLILQPLKNLIIDN